jgi:hypothetical protein
MEIIAKNLNLSSMRDFMNENFCKRGGGDFTYANVQLYVYQQKRLPKYLGKYRIEKVKEITSVNLYNIIKED